MSRTSKSNHLFVAALIVSSTMATAGCGDLEPHGVPVPAKDGPRPLLGRLPAVPAS